MHIDEKKTLKVIDNDLMAFSHGLVGWLTFQSKCKRWSAYNEHFLYGPLTEMAIGRGYHLYSEFMVELPKSSKFAKKNGENRGDKRRIDFCLLSPTDIFSARQVDMTRVETVVGIEVKWVLDNRDDKLDIQLDIEKLFALTSQFKKDFKPTNPKFQRYIVIAGRLSDMIRRGIKHEYNGKEKEVCRSYLDQLSNDNYQKLVCPARYKSGITGIPDFLCIPLKIAGKPRKPALKNLFEKQS
jgi:hypothetical protein